MTVLIFDENLLWTSRLANGVRAAGHSPVTFLNATKEWPAADVAIVNLGSAEFPAKELVPALRADGIKVVAHAGHKETELLELGKEVECDRLATNGELAKRLKHILAEFTEPKAEADVLPVG